MNLSEGANTLNVEVATGGGASEVYTVTVTRQSATSFGQQAYVKASNTNAGDEFGNSVALSGDTLAVGAPFEDSNATGGQNDNSTLNAGAVYVFVRSSGIWTQQAYIKASNTDAGDRFGYSVALDGDTLVVGAPFESSNSTVINKGETDNSAPNAGAVYVFVRSGTMWTQQAYVKGSNNSAGVQFGSSVALDGETLVVGAPYSGAVYVFVRTGDTWTQQAYENGGGDFFGWSVAVSGDILAVGAPFEDSSASGINGDSTDNSAVDSGAVYVFVRSGDIWTEDAYIKASN
ncbi:MAG: FG-GAP repeat protein, partial [Nitrospirae bacterium]|nr:FG-GAP repeat protein [Nitrospirota bacterium]